MPGDPSSRAARNLEALAGCGTVAIAVVGPMLLPPADAEPMMKPNVAVPVGINHRLCPSLDVRLRFVGGRRQRRDLPLRQQRRLPSSRVDGVRPAGSRVREGLHSYFPGRVGSAPGRQAQAPRRRMITVSVTATPEAAATSSQAHTGIGQAEFGQLPRAADEGPRRAIERRHRQQQPGPSVVTIKSTDKVFQWTGCEDWSRVKQCRSRDLALSGAGHHRGCGRLVIHNPYD